MEEKSLTTDPPAGKPRPRKVGLEASKTFALKMADGFVCKYLSGSDILDIGYRGYSEGVEPIVAHAIGVELDYPGYDGHTLPFADNSQDAVFSSHCLEHIDDFRAAIREWHRVLRIDGHMVIAVPHKFLYEKRISPPSRWNEDHKRFYTPGSLMQEVELSLEPNTYRLRHLIDNDLHYNYGVTPAQHAEGCYEIELVLQKIKKPNWDLEVPDEPEGLAIPAETPAPDAPILSPAAPKAASVVDARAFRTDKRSVFAKLLRAYRKARYLLTGLGSKLNRIAAEEEGRGQTQEPVGSLTGVSLNRLYAEVIQNREIVSAVHQVTQSSATHSLLMDQIVSDLCSAVGRVETILEETRSKVVSMANVTSLSSRPSQPSILSNFMASPNGFERGGENRRLCFMHIPKSSGTSMAAALEQALMPLPMLRGFDHVLFGGFTAFDSLSEEARGNIYADAALLPQIPTSVAGHFAYSTLKKAYPNGQLMTVLREPVSRVLSHWMFWRKHSTEDEQYWGNWAAYVRHAQRPLLDFLSEPEIAAQTDNVAVRMLVWPNSLLPIDDFIDPAHDSQLLNQALSRLADFAFVDIIEEPGFPNRMKSWLARPLNYKRFNETGDLPLLSRLPFHAQINEDTLELLQRRTRLDSLLWEGVATRYMTIANTGRFKDSIILSNIARYGALMAK